MEGGITLIKCKNTSDFTIIFLFSVLINQLLSIWFFCPLELLLNLTFRIIPIQEFTLQSFQMEVCIYWVTTSFNYPQGLSINQTHLTVSWVVWFKIEIDLNAWQFFSHLKHPGFLSTSPSPSLGTPVTILFRFLGCLYAICKLSPSSFAFSFFIRFFFAYLNQRWRGGLPSLYVKIHLTLLSFFFFLFWLINFFPSDFFALWNCFWIWLSG